MTSKTRNCEVSVHFYAKAILRGYLNKWVHIAERRYEHGDYEGALMLYSYGSLLGLPKASFSAGYLWEKGLTGRFRCALDHKYQCALYYYMNGIDYFKSQEKIADLIYWKIPKTL